jgi:hypothetical protein
MPAGIMTRFISRNHGLIEGQNYWKNGVVLTWEGTRARIMADALARKVRIAVAGRDTKGMLAIIRREMDHIHRTLNNPDLRQMFPCNCSQCAQGEPFLFDYQRVLKYCEGKVDKIRCDDSLIEVPIEALLSGVFDRLEVDTKLRSAEARTVVVYGDYVEGQKTEAPVMKEKKTSVPRSPWVSGGFYLLTAVVLVVLLAAVAKEVSVWVLPPVLIGGILLLTIIGALQLKTDAAIGEESFLKLMTLAFSQIPLLGRSVGKLTGGSKPENG